MQRTSIAKKAVLYAKAAAVLAVGAWMAFTPLVSPAQGLQAPQQKSIRARPPAPQASKGKTIAYLDAAGAQQKRGSAQAAEKQPQGQEKYDSTHPYAGVRRILVELAAQPDSAQSYSRKYVVLIDEIAAALQDSLGSAPAENRRLLSMLWKIMQSRLYFANDTKFISNSLMANLWDCDNSAAVAYDVLRKLGFSPETISLSGHLLLKNGLLDFETKTGGIYSHDSIGFYYPPPVSISSADAFIALAYFELGNRDLDSSRFESAIRNYKMAISIYCRDSDAHNNLGWAYESIGKYNVAIREYSLAIEMSPNRGIARLNRANLLEKLGRENEAQADRDEYYGVKGVKVSSSESK